MVGELDFRLLATNGEFLVGQEQDIVNGAFDKNQAFSGNVTQIEMWKTVLSNSDIRRLANCDLETVEPSKTEETFSPTQSEVDRNDPKYE